MAPGQPSPRVPGARRRTRDADEEWERPRPTSSAGTRIPGTFKRAGKTEIKVEAGFPMGSPCEAGFRQRTRADLMRE